MKHAALALLAFAFGCAPDPVAAPPAAAVAQLPEAPPPPPRTRKLIRVIVALCDNAHQGIVPVPARLGNGQDPASNLYWGAAYGVKTFFRRSEHWAPQPAAKPADPAILDQVAFRGRVLPVDLIAEAYDGAKMTAAVARFFQEAASGDADLVCFVGHNGLMDAPLGVLPARGRTNPSGSVVLACKSRAYFAEPLRRVGCPPLVTTSGFMAPEAYSLDALMRSWAAGGDASAMALQAGLAYARYQKCSESAARKLFVAGE